MAMRMPSFSLRPSRAVTYASTKGPTWRPSSATASPPFSACTPGTSPPNLQKGLPALTAQSFTVQRFDLSCRLALERYELPGVDTAYHEL